ncbi:MAG TPA: carboxypeptidase regulatory-like domain-containing protein [Terriglobales bacterium]|nr:carboxypeptidase regulatory-like domain-containing protein [Terriglobales bacterium]
MTRRKSVRFAVPCLVLTLFTLTSTTFAQTTGSIFGRAADPSGAVVAGASVTVTNQATGQSRQATTDANGEYNVPLLPVGTYSVTGDKQGFEKFTQRTVVVPVNTNVRVDMTFAVGKVTEAVEVVGGAEIVETRSSTLGKVIDERKIRELPLNDRNFLNFATLQPGVVPAAEITSNNTPDTGGGVNKAFQVNGLRLQSNNFLLDGVDNNEPFLGTAMASPSPDALDEFKIQTSLYSAEFGGGGGSIVNIITKGGTNEWHGVVYEFFRNDALDAQGTFALQKEKLRRNQFGFSLGGPIRKDKTFIFGNYEGFRKREGQTQRTTVPTLVERGGTVGIAPGTAMTAPQAGRLNARPGCAGDITGAGGTAPADGVLWSAAFPGGVIPVSCFDPSAAAILDELIPEPNTGTNQFTSSPATANNSNQFTLRLDQNFSDKNSLSVRYHFLDGDGMRFFTNTLFNIPIQTPDFPLADEFRIQNLAVSDTHLFSPTLTNEFHFGFNRGLFDSAIPVTPRDPASFGFVLPSTKAVSNMPLVAIAGMSSYGTFNDSPSFRRENVFQFQDNVNWVRGRHTIKFGFSYLKTQMDIPSSDSIAEGAFLFVPDSTGNPFANFLLGEPNLFFQGSGVTTREWRFDAFHWFFQDDVRVTRNFTLNLGLRYELNRPATDTQDRVVAFRPGQTSTVNTAASPGLLFVGDPGITRSTIETDKNNFAPRLGFAWDVRGDGKVSVRGGYGIFYDRVIGLVPFQFGLVPPFFPIPTLPNPFIATFSDPFGGGSPFTGLTAQEVADLNLFPLFSFVQVLDPGFRSPYVQQWNTTVQWEAVKDLVFELGYVGTKSTKLVQAVNLNTDANHAFAAPFFPFFFQLSNYQTTGAGNFHALQLSANKRFSHGLTLLSSYTWGHSIDNASQPVNFLNPTGEAPFPQNRTRLDLERARSSYDARHRWVTSFLYELPWFRDRRDAVGQILGGWNTNGILTVQSGVPFTPLTGGDTNCDGVDNSSDRPNRVADPFSGVPSGFFFNPAAFSVPVCADGTAGRNSIGGPGITNFDWSLNKRFQITERTRLEFRTEFFNLFNTPSLGTPVNVVSNPQFGTVQNLRQGTNARQIQFGLRLSF